MTKPMTTTGYLALGLLGVRPWTAYELKRQFARGPLWFWPRSGNKLYDIPKDLVARGLATAERGATGRRPRTVYSITAEGRSALRGWLEQPSAAPSVEVEALARALLADQGPQSSLAATIDGLLAQIDEMQSFGGRIGQEYGDTGGPFPDRLHVNVLVFEFMWRYTEALRSWAEWAKEEVACWDGTGPQPARTDRHMARYRDVGETLAKRTSSAVPAPRRG